MRPKRRVFYEVVPPDGWRWDRNRMVEEEPRLYHWRDRIRRADTAEKAFRIAEAAQPGTIVRVYRHHKYKRPWPTGGCGPAPRTLRQGIFTLDQRYWVFA